MNQGATPVLSVEGLRLSFAAPVVRGVDFTVAAGTATALVGESGSGKTLSCLSILGLQPYGSSVSGSARLRDTELIGLEETELRAVRARRAGFIFQDPRKYLNPSIRVGAQIEETIRRGLGIGGREAGERSLALLDSAGLDAKRVARSYPHELSGGMCQRANIVLAISCGPELLIADEPTTALDASVQRSILDLLLEMIGKTSMGMVFVSHDLRAVDYVADRVAVMLSGLIVESGPRREVIERPAHPYTRLLLRSLPDESFTDHRAARGAARQSGGSAAILGCPFLSRCRIASDECAATVPGMTDIGGGHSVRCPKSMEVS